MLDPLIACYSIFNTPVRLDVMVYWDESFQMEFGKNSRQRAEKIMELVKPKLKKIGKTQIDFFIVGYEYAKGQNWTWTTTDNALTNAEKPLGKVAAKSKVTATLYVALVGSCKGCTGPRGTADSCTVCKNDRSKRINLSRYTINDDLTALVRFNFTSAPNFKREKSKLK